MKTMQLSLGQLNPKESKQILLDVINTNINYYKLKNLSSQVNWEKPDMESKRKIEELREASKDILSEIQKEDPENRSIKIDLSISIGISNTENRTEQSPSLELNGIKE